MLYVFFRNLIFLHQILLTMENIPNVNLARLTAKEYRKSANLWLAIYFTKFSFLHSTHHIESLSNTPVMKCAVQWSEVLKISMRGTWLEIYGTTKNLRIYSISNFFLIEWSVVEPKYAICANWPTRDLWVNYFIIQK
jgi:hypothetical protein